MLDNTTVSDALTSGAMICKKINTSSDAYITFGRIWITGTDASDEMEICYVYSECCTKLRRMKTVKTDKLMAHQAYSFFLGGERGARSAVFLPGVTFFCG